ncbi:MAG: putative dehydrogenase [Frondihabitans sp.]|nr:putative dehydrogenase [Frondihabitans sp.]
MQRIFLIGAGFIARQHALAAASLSADGLEVELHVVDVDARALSSFADEFPSAIVHSEVGEMLAAPRFLDDVAVVATPPFTHYALADAALAAGFHVLCEKPLAMNSDEARKLAATARELGLVLESCDSRFRSVPATQRAAQIVAGTQLGGPYHVTFRNKARRSRSGIDFQPESAWFRDPARSGGGVLMDWGPYDIAVLDELFTPVRVDVVHAWEGYPRTEGAFADETARAEHHVGATLRLTTDAGQVIAVDYERAACTHGAESSLVEIEGSTGAVRWDWLDWLGDRVVLETDDGGVPQETVEHHPVVDAGFHARPLRELVQWLADEVDSRIRTDRAEFTFSWLRAIAATTADGTPRAIVRQVTDGEQDPTLPQTTPVASLIPRGTPA